MLYLIFICISPIIHLGIFVNFGILAAFINKFLWSSEVMDSTADSCAKKRLFKIISDCQLSVCSLFSHHETESPLNLFVLPLIRRTDHAHLTYYWDFLVPLCCQVLNSLFTAQYWAELWDWQREELPRSTRVFRSVRACVAADRAAAVSGCAFCILLGDL